MSVLVVARDELAGQLAADAVVAHGRLRAEVVQDDVLVQQLLVEVRPHVPVEEVALGGERECHGRQAGDARGGDDEGGLAAAEGAPDVESLARRERTGGHRACGFAEVAFPGDGPQPAAFLQEASGVFDEGGVGRGGRRTGHLAGDLLRGGEKVRRVHR